MPPRLSPICEEGKVEETEDGDRRDFVSLEEEKLDLLAPVRDVQRNDAGAVATFVGTTRDTFQGKVVTRLEYEAYEPMAVKELRRLCGVAREKWPDLQDIAIVHRVGSVPVGDASVIVAVSSAHRKPALQSCAWLIDELKVTVPIWKKEWYADGTANWKDNACCARKQADQREEEEAVEPTA